MLSLVSDQPRVAEASASDAQGGGGHPPADRRGLLLLLAWFLGAALLGLFLVATDLSLPGVYDDEVVQASEAIQFLRGDANPDGIEGSRSVALFGRMLPFMTQPYMGALKSQLLIPIFGACGISAQVLRSTTLVWALLGVLLAMLWLRELVSLPAAVVAGLVIATDPSFLLVSRHDFGSFALGMLFRCGGLLFLTVGWTRQRSAWLGLGGLCLGLGIYNKVDFAAFIIAAAISLLIAAPKVVLDAVRSWRVRLLPAALGFALGAAPMLLFAAETLEAAGRAYATRGNAAVSLLDKWTTLITTLDGSHFHSLMLAGGAFRRLYGGGEAASWFFAVFLLATVVLIARVIDSGRRGSPDRISLFLLSTTFLTVLGILLIPRAVRIHHLMNVYPLPQLVVAVAIARIWTACKEGRGPRWMASGLAGLLLLTTVIGNLYVDVQAMKTIHVTGGKGRWSEARLQFAQTLLERSQRPTLVALDWGFRWSLLFAAPELRVVEPIYELKRAAQRERAAEGRSSGPGWAHEGSRDTIYLLYPPSYSTFTYGARLLEAIEALPTSAATVRRHQDGEGDVAFLSVSIDGPHRLEYDHGLRLVME